MFLFQVAEEQLPQKKQESFKKIGSQTAAEGAEKSSNRILRAENNNLSEKPTVKEVKEKLSDFKPATPEINRGWKKFTASVAGIAPNEVLNNEQLEWLHKILGANYYNKLRTDRKKREELAEKVGGKEQAAKYIVFFGAYRFALDTDLKVAELLKDVTEKDEIDTIDGKIRNNLTSIGRGDLIKAWDKQVYQMMMVIAPMLGLEPPKSGKDIQAYVMRSMLQRKLMTDLRTERDDDIEIGKKNDFFTHPGA